MCAFDLPDGKRRDEVRDTCYKQGMMILGCGDRSLRFRPALTVTTDVIDEGLTILRKVLKATA